MKGQWKREETGAGEGRREQAALGRWEGEGGRVEPRAPAARAGADGAGEGSGPSAQGQPGWEFYDPSGRFSYAFYRVYEPARGSARRGPFSVLDEARSYWALRWTARGADGEEREVERRLSYAEARDRDGPRLRFARFASSLWGPEQLLLAERGGPGSG